MSQPTKAESKLNASELRQELVCHLYSSLSEKTYKERICASRELSLEKRKQNNTFFLYRSFNQECQHFIFASHHIALPQAMCF